MLYGDSLTEATFSCVLAFLLKLSKCKFAFSQRGEWNFRQGKKAEVRRQFQLAIRSLVQRLVERNSDRNLSTFFSFVDIATYDLIGLLEICYKKFQDDSNAHNEGQTRPSSSTSNFHLKFVGGSHRRHFELNFNDFGINLIVWSMTVHLLY